MIYVRIKALPSLLRTIQNRWHHQHQDRVPRTSDLHPCLSQSRLASKTLPSCPWLWVCSFSCNQSTRIPSWFIVRFPRPPRISPQVRWIRTRCKTSFCALWREVRIVFTILFSRRRCLRSWGSAKAEMVWRIVACSKSCWMSCLDLRFAHWIGSNEICLKKITC